MSSVSSSSRDLSGSVMSPMIFYSPPPPPLHLFQEEKALLVTSSRKGLIVTELLLQTSLERARKRLAASLLRWGGGPTASWYRSLEAEERTFSLPLLVWRVYLVCEDYGVCNKPSLDRSPKTSLSNRHCRYVMSIVDTSWSLAFTKRHISPYIMYHLIWQIERSITKVHMKCSSCRYAPPQD